jgi:hypothetical protein
LSTWYVFVPARPTKLQSEFFWWFETNGRLRLPFVFWANVKAPATLLAAILRLGLAVGEDFIALHQPAANQLPENGNFLWRTQSFAMNDANAALAPVQALGQEGRKQLARFIAIQGHAGQFHPE